MPSGIHLRLSKLYRRLEFSPENSSEFEGRTPASRRARRNFRVNEAFSVRKIEGSLKASTGIMKDVNALVRLPELTGTMRELSQELVKAGIIEEMVGDLIPDSDLLEGEDEEIETEVDKVLGDVLKDKLPAQAEKPVTEPNAAQSIEEDDEAEEELLEQMRGRLEALKS